jgi:hypothetical protein
MRTPRRRHFTFYSGPNATVIVGVRRGSKRLTVAAQHDCTRRPHDDKLRHSRLFSLPGKTTYGLSRISDPKVLGVPVRPLRREVIRPLHGSRCLRVSWARRHDGADDAGFEKLRARPISRLIGSGRMTPAWLES